MLFILRFSSLHKGDNILDYLKKKIDDLQFNGKHHNQMILGSKILQSEIINGEKNLNYLEKYLYALHIYKSMVLIERTVIGYNNRVERRF